MLSLPEELGGELAMPPLTAPFPPQAGSASGGICLASCQLPFHRAWQEPRSLTHRPNALLRFLLVFASLFLALSVGLTSLLQRDAQRTRAAFDLQAHRVVFPSPVISPDFALHCHTIKEFSPFISEPSAPLAFPGGFEVMMRLRTRIVL